MTSIDRPDVRTDATVDSMKAETQGPAETRALGREIGKCLELGDVVAVAGTLGVGKTVFAQGVGDGLDLREAVRSPTYTVVATHRDGRLPFLHVDLYRLHGEADLDSIDWDGLFDEPAIVVVEWPERAGDRLPRDHLWVGLDDGGGDRRMIVLIANGKRASRILRALEASRA